MKLPRVRRVLAPLSVCAALAAVCAPSAASAQTRVLVLGDGSTMFSAVSYYNAAISEFAAVVGSGNVQGRNDLDRVTLAPADLRRAGGESYDVVVLVASFNGIGTGNWTLLREAVRTRAARSFVFFSDHCSICNGDNVDGGSNGNGVVPLLNAASGWSTRRGTLRTAPLPVPLNTRSPLSASFAGMNPMQTYDYHSIDRVPVDNALYLAPGASLPAAGVTLLDDVSAVLLPTSQSYGGLGACVFSVTDVNPLAIPGNPGRIGPAFVDAINAPTGSCAAGPLTILTPTSGTVTANPSPPITGLAQPGATVVVRVGTQTLTTTAAADGTWTVTPAPLAEGSYTATATRTLGGVTQTASTSFSVTVCGNGAIAGAERCDDGNTMAGDGCSATCAVEAGYVCRGDRSVCAITCGDGVRAATEACDDGNVTANDGCSPTCALEDGWRCTTPDTSVFYSHRGVDDCVVVPDFEPASSATVPARLAVPGVGVWGAYRARYVSGAVDFSDRPTSWRAPTLLQWDPGTGVRAAVFGGLVRTGQTSPSLARAVAERVTYDFAVGVEGSVRAATPDIPMACGNNSNDAITWRIDAMSVCAPTCTDSSPAGTDTGCSATAPHCRTLMNGGARCEVCLDSATTGADLGCATATPYCAADAMGALRCVACVGAGDCDDGNPCTVDACSSAGACVRSAVTAGEAGACEGGRVCSGGDMGRCVACVGDAQCGGATPRCDTAMNVCVALPDAGSDVPDVMDVMDVMDVADVSDVMDVADVTDASDASDAGDASDVTDAGDATDASDAARDAGMLLDAATITVEYQGSGCGCAVPGSSRTGDGRALLAVAALSSVVARRRRRR